MRTCWSRHAFLPERVALAGSCRLMPPRNPARPSQTDLDRAWPDLVYMIVAIRGGQAAEWTCWTLNVAAKRFDPVK